MPKILMIDDDREFGSIAETHFRGQGYAFTLITSGRDGLAKAASLKPDLIMLDISMPDMNGIEVLRELQVGDETSDIPVLVVSGKYFDQGMYEIFNQERNFRGFVSKPVSLTTLQQRAAEVIGKK